jgi:3-methyladenine DNA glycosylase AlkD
MRKTSRSEQGHAAALLEKMKQIASPTQADHTRQSLGTQLPLLGVAVMQVKEVAREFLKSHGDQVDLKSAFSTSRELWETGYLEARVLGLLILRRFEKQFDERIWQLAEHWLNEIDDWSLCDTLCVCLTAPMVAADIAKAERLIGWAEAKSPWQRRAAIVSLRRLHRQAQSQPEAIFRVCERFMQDTEWPVRKALGFTLRDVGIEAPEQLAEFLKQWKLKTHRSVIREATKKLSLRLRQAVLSD